MCRFEHDETDDGNGKVDHVYEATFLEFVGDVCGEEDGDAGACVGRDGQQLSSYIK